jgi:hypothetical protein
MQRLLNDLTTAAGWNRDTFWGYRDNQNVFLKLCQAAYSNMFNAECDVPVMEAMLYRLPAAYLREEGNQLSQWADLASDTRHRNFDDEQNIRIIWEFTPEH